MMKLTLLATAITLSSAAYAECAKGDAEKAVNNACEWYQKEGKENAWKKVKKLRFCGNNYVWYQDESDGVRILVHPVRPRLTRKKALIGIKDPDGNELFKDFREGVKKQPEGAWVSYVWAKPSEDTAKPKVSYLKRCADGVVAGSGVWVEDMPAPEQKWAYDSYPNKFSKYKK